MTFENTQTVQNSWALLRPEIEAFTGTVFDNLFTRDPSLRAKFPSDMRPQLARFQSTLNMAICWLHSPEVVSPVLEDLGASLMAQGIDEDHFTFAKFAMLDALTMHLGPKFDHRIQRAWEEAFESVLDIMHQDVTHAPALAA